ncbi:hypothetical protein GFH32_08795 [Sphingobacteruim zhuxiongii]|uniref:Uncharacterized protein n=1 Tax=Sphingobacterium zhuxiongii TaxID=2662364 RepID=A0A5Q0QB78_9SPHI|nr:hypothetical protein GFH32_08795 [Sphingobacterium sp. dk4302]
MFSIILLAKQSGDFTIPASQFVFHANSNADDFKERLLTNQSTAQQPNKYKFDVRSNTLQFKVQ